MGFHIINSATPEKAFDLKKKKSHFCLEVFKNKTNPCFWATVEKGKPFNTQCCLCVCAWLCKYTCLRLIPDNLK